MVSYFKLAPVLILKEDRYDTEVNLGGRYKKREKRKKEGERSEKFRIFCILQIHTNYSPLFRNRFVNGFVNNATALCIPQIFVLFPFQDIHSSPLISTRKLSH